MTIFFGTGFNFNKTASVVCRNNKQISVRSDQNYYGEIKWGRFSIEMIDEQAKRSTERR